MALTILLCLVFCVATLRFWWRSQAKGFGWIALGLALVACNQIIELVALLGLRPRYSLRGVYSFSFVAVLYTVMSLGIVLILLGVRLLCDQIAIPRPRRSFSLRSLLRGMFAMLAFILLIGAPLGGLGAQFWLRPGSLLQQFM